MNQHCKPGDDCHCSEKTEKTINKLFYERYSNQFEETAGEIKDGKITTYFFNKLTDQSVAASLDDDGELVVEVI